MIETSNEQQIHYIGFNELRNPEFSEISINNIQEGFQSKEWRKNFQTLTHLRQANRFYSNVFQQQLLPKTYNHVIQQIDNLRSNNSKEALTLVWEFFQHQNIQALNEDIICSLLSAVFVKSVCEKAFLKNQALKAINTLPKKYHPSIAQELGNLTQSHNGLIAELAIKILGDYMENNKIINVTSQFLKMLAKNIDGKRSVLQKKGKEILIGLKKRIGENKLEEVIKEAVLSEEDSALLLRELKEKNTKQQTNFRDFLKQKKVKS